MHTSQRSITTQHFKNTHLVASLLLPHKKFSWFPCWCCW